MSDAVDQYAEQVRQWAADWADAFDQSWSQEKLEALVGKRVKAEKPATEDEGPRGFKDGVVVGYSIDKLVFTPEDGAETQTVFRYSLVLANGMQTWLLSEMVVEEIE